MSKLTKYSKNASSQKWTSIEDDTLKAHYAIATKEELETLIPNRSAAACLLRGSRLGLKRPYKSSINSISALLEDTPTAAYWMGYVMADGSFKGYKYNRLSVSTAEQDGDHLVDFAKWLSPEIRIYPYTTNKGYKGYNFSVQDRLNAPKIREKFDIKPQKTYNPPEILPYQETLLLKSWLIGFIDGDGSIKQQKSRITANITTVSHISWLPYLKLVSEHLGMGYVKIRKIDDEVDTLYANLCFYAFSEVINLKRFAIENNLPVLVRKWSKIDGDLTLKNERYIRLESE